MPPRCLLLLAGGSWWHPSLFEANLLAGSPPEAQQTRIMPHALEQGRCPHVTRRL